MYHLFLRLFIITVVCYVITENHFQESRCTKQIDNLRECCKKFHEISLVCSGMKPTEINQNTKVNKYINCTKLCLCIEICCSAK